MKKAVFSGKLYLEGLRRLTMLGVISTVLAAVVTVIGLATASSSTLGAEWFIFFASILLPALFIMHLFSFLHRRAGSDFHHALAQSRLAVCLSLWAAAMTWVLFILGVCTLLWLGFGGEAILSFFSCMGSIALLVGGVSLLAVSVTGTRFTAIAVLLIVLFLPRLLIDSFIYLLYAQLPMFQGGGNLWFDALRLNVLTNILYEDFFYRSLRVAQYYSSAAGLSLPGYVYTAVLGLVYAALGGWAFCRRRSEIAGQAIPSRLLQAVWRLSLAMLLCVPPCLFILCGVNTTYHRTQVALFYIAALVVYFLYELLTTRRWESLLRVVPGLLVLVVLNVAFIGGFILCRDHILSFNPEAEEITAVRLAEPRQLMLSYDGWTDGWIEYQVKEISLTDEDTKRLVADNLQQAVEKVKRLNTKTDGTAFSVIIESEDKEYTRTLYLSQEEILQLRNAYAKNQEFQKLYTELPSPDEDGVTLNRFGNLTGNAAQEVYAVFQEEVQTVNFDRWFTFVRNPSGSLEDIHPFESIYVELTVREAGQDYRLYMTLPVFFEKTYTAYLNTVQAESRDKVRLLLQGEMEGVTLYVSLFRCAEYEGVLTSTLVPGEDVSDEALLTELAGYLSDETVDVTKPTVTVRVRDTESEEEYEATFMLKDGTIPPLLYSRHSWALLG